VHTSRGTRAIETIRIGQRVITYLPHERTEPEPEEPTAMEWAAHRVITLLLPCEDEQWIRMQLLRDPDWFRMMAPEVGETIFLDMPEMGVEGDAIVEAIEPCPEIEIGEGRVVTATFHHSSGECLEVDIEGEDQPLRVTAGHPIWRVDGANQPVDVHDSDVCGTRFGCGCERSHYTAPVFDSIPELQELQVALSTVAGTLEQELDRILITDGLHPNWTPAGELRPGDVVSTQNGPAVIRAIRTTDTACRVANIEVDGDHVYRVTESGTLVHNESPGGNSDCNYCADKGYTYVPRPPGYSSWTAYVVAKCGGSTTGVENQHGHHIVMKAKFAEYTEPSRQILCKNGINPFIDDCRNLVISPNHCHSLAYAKWVYEKLKEADDRGDSIEAVLSRAARYHKDCRDPGRADDNDD
jgi:hypothetical protein